MTLPEKSESKPLDVIYVEASQWVRFANTMVWTMGAFLVPASLGLVVLALNTSSGARFSLRAKAILGVGSIFLFSFWVYASRIYRGSASIARKVLIGIEKRWRMENGISLYRQQAPLVNQPSKLFPLQIRLFPLQMITLGVLVIVWGLIIYLEI
jgi:hypothetical protein